MQTNTAINKYLFGFDGSTCLFSAFNLPENPSRKDTCENQNQNTFLHREDSLYWKEGTGCWLTGFKAVIRAKRSRRKSLPRPFSPTSSKKMYPPTRAGLWVKMTHLEAFYSQRTAQEAEKLYRQPPDRALSFFMENKIYFLHIFNIYRANCQVLIKAQK
jgi:hypothetical protein